jgi:hypothetical protein
MTVTWTDWGFGFRIRKGALFRLKLVVYVGPLTWNKNFFRRQDVQAASTFDMGG